MDKPYSIKKLFNLTKPKRKWNLFLPYNVLPNRYLARKL